MKLAAFSVSELEKPYFDKAKEKYNIEFIIQTNENLTLEVAQNLPEGIDGVLVLPQEKTTRAIIEVLKAKGIYSLATRSAGVDAIDVVAAEELGIHVTNVAAYSPQAIAEFAVMLILNSLRHISQVNTKMQAGNFLGSPFIAHQLDSRVVGIIGYGHIGQCVARLLQPFNPQLVVYTNEEVAEELQLPNMKIEKEFNRFIETVNVITIHCPFTPETYHLINENTLQKMSPEMIIVNTARGPIVDAKAVLKALANNQINFYATDVYEHEDTIFRHKFSSIADIKDPIFQQMLADEKISITPHIAFNTYTSVQNMVYFSIENSLAISKKQ